MKGRSNFRIVRAPVVLDALASITRRQRGPDVGRQRDQQTGSDVVERAGRLDLARPVRTGGGGGWDEFRNWLLEAG